jgi:hypothetical protein
MQVDKRIKEDEQNGVVIGRQIPDTQRMGQMKGESTSRDSIVTSCRSRETKALISNYREKKSGSPLFNAAGFGPRLGIW